MTGRDYRLFRKEFDELSKKHNLGAYTLVLLIDADKGEEESHTVVLSRVPPEEEIGVFMENTRQLLFGLARTMLEIVDPFFGLGPEAALGLIQGIVADISEERHAEELHELTQETESARDELPPIPRVKKAKPEWH